MGSVDAVELIGFFQEPAALGLEGCCFALVRGPINWKWNGRNAPKRPVIWWNIASYILTSDVARFFAVCSVPLKRVYIYISMYICIYIIVQPICEQGNIYLITMSLLVPIFGGCLRSNRKHTLTLQLRQPFAEKILAVCIGFLTWTHPKRRHF